MLEKTQNHNNNSKPMNKLAKQSDFRYQFQNLRHKSEIKKKKERIKSNTPKLARIN